MLESAVTRSSKPFCPQRPTFKVKGTPPASQPFQSRPSASASVSNRPNQHLTLEELRQTRKTLRTYIRTLDGGITDAKIDLATGEVTPHQYRTQSSRYKVRAPDHVQPCENPPWVQIPTAIRSIRAGERDPSRKRVFNDLRTYLDGYLTLWEALADLPVLDPLVTGALQLDLGGNTRSLNPNLIFALLQQLDWISPDTVESFVGCSIRHAQRIALVLRIILNGFREVSKGGLTAVRSH